MFIDTHCHLNFPDFTDDLDAVLDRALAANVTRMIAIGTNPETIPEVLNLAQKYDQIFATLGMHPYDADKLTDETLLQWEALILANKKVLAIGECGLDYFRSEVEKSVQRTSFEKQLQLAQKLNLPVVVHNREADEDTLAILKDYKVKAVFHCYTSSLAFAEKLWSYGFCTSFTGVITYSSAADLLEVVRAVPLDKFFIETDAPYLAPQSNRGKRNEPAFVPEVAQKIAEVKGLPLTEIASISTSNAESFFGL